MLTAKTTNYGRASQLSAFPIHPILSRPSHLFALNGFLPNFSSKRSLLESYRSSSALTGIVVKTHNQRTQLTGNAQSLSRNLCRNICASSDVMCGVLKIGDLCWQESGLASARGLQPVRAGGAFSSLTMAASKLSCPMRFRIE